MNKRGFTLIELSIVLVIIGLLVGGILVAQSMISAARATNIVRMIGQYDIAATNFYNNYKQWPGDSSYFTPAGNGDGDMEGGAGTEEYGVFTHLSQAAMIKDSFVSLASSGFVSYEEAYGVTFPVFSKADTSFTPAMTAGKNYSIGGKDAANTNFYYEFSANAQDAMAIWYKMGGAQFNTNVKLSGGLTSAYSSTICVADVDEALCTAPQAYAVLRYYLLPI